MINSASSSNRAARTEQVTSLPSKITLRSSGSDNFSASGSSTLREALVAQPEIRPEVVARGLQLAADPHYPSTAIIQQVSQKILNSPDLSADQA